MMFFFLILGFLFRLILGSFFVHSLIWDMGAYHEMALRIFNGELVTHCCIHGIGYPLFLAGIFKIFGQNLVWVRIIQALIDTASAYLILRTSSKLFGKKAGWFSFLLFLINPFTSAYTGAILTETVAVFIIAAISFLLASYNDYNNYNGYNHYTHLLLGFFSGFLIITKMSFFYFLAFLLPFLLYVVSESGRLKLRFVLLFAGFIIAISYPLIGNYVNFRKISVSPPYQTSFFLAYYFANHPSWRYPELDADIQKGYPPKLVEISNEYYYFVENNPQGLTAFHQKYLKLYLENLKTTWRQYLRNTFQNMVWIWDKRYIYLYTDPTYPKIEPVWRMVTGIYFLSASIGLFAFLRKNPSKGLKNPVFILTLSLFLYISLVLSVATNESRVAIPFYPLLLLWAGYGMHYSYQKVKTKMQNENKNKNY